MPAVSVIIPMYNVRPYIEDCLLSLKRQTFGDFEALCVDDGSTDGTLEAARKGGRRRRSLLIPFSGERGAVCRAQCGHRPRDGEVRLFLDSDDYYEDRALQMLFERAERDGLDDLFFSARTLYEGEDVRARYHDEYGGRSDIDGIMTGRELMVRFVEEDSFCVSPGMQFVRKSFSTKLAFGSTRESCTRTTSSPAHAGLGAANRLSERVFVREAGAARLHDDRGSRDQARVRSLQGSVRDRGVAARPCGECSEAFVRVLLRHVAFCYDRAAFDALSLDEAQLEACATQLAHRIRRGCVVSLARD